MKASVLIVVVVLSAISMGSAAVLLLDAKPATRAKVSGADHPEFRWGEGTEASIAPVKTEDER